MVREQLGRQHDLGKNLRVHQRLPIHLLLWNPASGETQDRQGSVLVQKSGHVDDDVQTSALHVVYEMEKCWIGIEDKMRDMSREVI